MRVPLSWLKELTPVEVDPGDEAAVRDLGGELSLLGLPLEGTERFAAELEGVVLSRVMEIRPIEGADRIRLVVVDAGGREPVEVVCGAWNFARGDVVPLATVGARLGGGVEITRRQMRGVTSEGMICSGRELGLAADATGIYILASPGNDRPLPYGVELGQSIVDYLGLEADVVFDLEIESNRPDCLSMLGIARDLAAHKKLPLEVPQPEIVESGPAVGELASVKIESPQGCKRLVARVVTGIEDMVSPELVRRRLILCGMRPINAVVDASNYTMLEFGQPTHPYDLDRLDGRGLIVRFARRGEHLVTLDGVDRTLGEVTERSGSTEQVEDLLICDADGGPVGLAGIMGGAASEIRPETGDVLIESGEFTAVVVGRTVRRQDLRTEAAVRFWRGIDPEGVVRGADRVAQLIMDAADKAGAPRPSVARGVLDEHPTPTPRIKVRVRTGRVNAILGTNLDAATISSYLVPIGFGTAPTDDGLVVEIPSWRPDTTIEVDVIEEVARHYGYENIAPTTRRSAGVGRLDAHQRDRRALARALSGFGAYEAWTSPIINPELERLVGQSISPVELTNPIVHEERALRTHLLPGLLSAIRRNVASRNPSVRFFENGHVFFRPGGDGALPVEREELGVALARDGDGAATAVNCLRWVLEAIRIDPEGLELDQKMDGNSENIDSLTLGCHPTRTAIMRATREGSAPVVGVVGEVDPKVLAAFDIPGRRVGWLLFDVERFFALPRLRDAARPVSRFPSSDIDLSFALDEKVPARALGEILEKAAGQWCERVELVDVYRGRGLDPGVRSLSYRIRFAALDRTLTDADVAEARARCIDAAEREVGAVLRG
ncbi:MAG TPA: phenylalanine--tRNA ligase subunit beta [Acidimicrobiales bacterium]|nr:phenylalanine--tRNA ligase subunit beta [Acidimicrobiales bacterium]